jgi:hypothetical protein
MESCGLLGGVEVEVEGEVNDPDCLAAGFGVCKNLGGSDEGSGAGRAAIIYV